MTTKKEKYKLSTSIESDVVYKLKLDALKKRTTVSKLLEDMLKEKYKMNTDRSEEN